MYTRVIIASPAALYKSQTTSVSLHTKYQRRNEVYFDFVENGDTGRLPIVTSDSQDKAYKASSLALINLCRHDLKVNVANTMP